ncbi:hypothetical protein ACP70R_035993 [Stipagrostis hirtigluma subsp. patula]
MADPRREMAALQHRIAQSRQRASSAAAAFSADLLAARTLAHQNVAHREKLNGLKDQLRKLEAQLAESLSIQASKRSKYKLIEESISNTAATNEQLKSLIVDHRTRIDKYRSDISNQLETIEALEANSGAKDKNDTEEAVMWYSKFLDLQVVGGQGVRFVFHKIDIKNPDKEYSFCIKITKDRYSLLQCVPSLEDSKELLDDLNCTNDLFKFVRIMRERFQAAAINGFLPDSSFCPETSCITASSTPALSGDSRSESATNQSYSKTQTKKQNISMKKELPSRSATSAHSVRRSPRILVNATKIAKWL